MYNAKQMEAFIDKVNKEASAAAQAVYDKYQLEFESRIRKQLQAGDTILFGMGTCTFSGDEDKPYGYAEKFLDELSRTQYTDLEAGFSTDTVTRTV